MYDWRTMSDKERARTVSGRKVDRQPWHAPPKFDHGGKTEFLVTAACYEHRHIIGFSNERLRELEKALIEICGSLEAVLFAWCVLHNHYHILIKTEDIREFQIELGKIHGKTSYRWNREEGAEGRKVWYRSFERAIKSRGHFFATVNYIHNNPVKHGYVKRWQDWPFSSAAEYLD